ncbi:hypothetical protein [Plesiomonas shigelloides]|uniref:hypothetical protein n=1 Tax=Plesiomonas shigelloides TaxID=703 RepID=UPI0009078EB1|nr:hypothetical protein [Plesiomonas shigelloides]
MKLNMLLIFLFFASVHVVAADFVYRIDDRPPSEIFGRGFTSKGSNMIFTQHISGESCHRLGNSAFIATTSSLESARAIAASIFNANRDDSRTLYLYTIRADSDFYNIEPTVDYLETRGEVFTSQQFVMMATQREVVALRRISDRNVQSVTPIIYSGSDHQMTDGVSQSNAAYVDRDTVVNQGVIPGVQTSSGVPVNRIAAFGLLFSSCFYSYKNKNASYDEFYNAIPIIDRMAMPPNG